MRVKELSKFTDSEFVVPCIKVGHITATETHGYSCFQYVSLLSNYLQSNYFYYFFRYMKNGWCQFLLIGVVQPLYISRRYGRKTV